MTNENAINILRHLSPPRTSKEDYDAFRQTIEMAIEALKEPKLIRCKECKWFGNIGCAIKNVSYLDRPTENDFCSYIERRE